MGARDPAWERGPGADTSSKRVCASSPRGTTSSSRGGRPAKGARVIATSAQAGRAAHPTARPHLAAPPDLSFEDQIHLFRSRYPGGFEDRAWIARYRGTSEGRRAKGHATPAIAEARTALSAEVLDRALAVDGTAVIIAAATSVLEHTSLLTGHQIQPLREVSPNRSGHFVQVLRDLLKVDAYELRSSGGRRADTRGPRQRQLARRCPRDVDRPARCVRPQRSAIGK